MCACTPYTTILFNTSPVLHIQYIYHFTHYMSTNDVEIHPSVLNYVSAFGMDGD